MSELNVMYTMEDFWSDETREAMRDMFRKITGGFYTLNFDGSCMAYKPGGPTNPGGIMVGGWVISDEAGSVVAEGGKVFGNGREDYYIPVVNTNNRSEFMALITGMLEASRMGIKNLHVIGDSQVIVYSMATPSNVTGHNRYHSSKYTPIDDVRDRATIYRCNNLSIRELWGQAHSIVWSRFHRISFEWVRRDKNERADQITREVWKAHVKSQRKVYI